MPAHPPQAKLLRNSSRRKSNHLNHLRTPEICRLQPLHNASLAHSSQTTGGIPPKSETQAKLPALRVESPPTMTSQTSQIPNFSLAGQTALVTASARGLGRAIAVALAAAGADVALGLRDKNTAKDLVAEIEALGRHAFPLQMDGRVTAAALLVVSGFIALVYFCRAVSS